MLREINFVNFLSLVYNHDLSTCDYELIQLATTEHAKHPEIKRRKSKYLSLNDTFYWNNKNVRTKCTCDFRFIEFR